jgi:hypothetical protein
MFSVVLASSICIVGLLSTTAAQSTPQPLVPLDSIVEYSYHSFDYQNKQLNPSSARYSIRLSDKLKKMYKEDIFTNNVYFASYDFSSNTGLYYDIMDDSCVSGPATLYTSVQDYIDE